MPNTPSARLYLLPNTLGSVSSPSSADSFVTPLMREICCTIKLLFAEDVKTARRLFRVCGYTGDFSEIEILLLNEHSEKSQNSVFIERLKQSGSGAIVSDAGIPCVADPGSALVSMAHEHEIVVVPMSGPSSIILTLAASGLGGQRFNFHGYLPKEATERRKKIRQMEQESAGGVTQIFMDTPYRNMQILEDVFVTCKKTCMLCIGCEVTTDKGFVKTKTIEEWMRQRPDLHKRPVIFAIGRSD
jgi:16S rRNA (cytidine1402-2'-O)-methyltransferase